MTLTMPLMFTVRYCRDDTDGLGPLFSPGSTYDRMFVAQALQGWWFPVGTVLEDDQGTHWITYPEDGVYYLWEARWDDAASCYLPVEDGPRRYKPQNGQALHPVK